MCSIMPDLPDVCNNVRWRGANNTASDIISGCFIKYYLRYIKCIILTGNLYENMLI